MIPVSHRLLSTILSKTARRPHRIYYPRLNERQHTSQQSSSSQSTATNKRGLALVMGVANQRSIAWGCVESFLQKNYDCIITYHIPSQQSSNNNDHNSVNENDMDIIHKEKYKSMIEKLASPYMYQSDYYSNTGNSTPSTHDLPPRIIACVPCCVQTGIPQLCHELIPNILLSLKDGRRTIDTIVHSIAYASEMDRPLLQVSSTAYLQAQHISAYSLIELVRECVRHRLFSESDASVTTLSYLGAVRTVPNYGTMSPAKAALESIVRTLAYEVGNLDDTSSDAATRSTIRVNAVSAGPLKTLSARGIPNFTNMQQHVVDHAPLRRNVTLEEVAETITWLSIHGTGITGQTIYVDAGYSSMVHIGKV